MSKLIVDDAEKYRKTEGSLEEGLKKAVRQCLKEGVLVEFLQKYAIEVTNMIYQQMTFEEYDQMRFDDGKEVGKEIGKEIGMGMGENLKLVSLVRKKLKKSQSVELIAEALEEMPKVIESIVNAIRENSQLSDKEIMEIDF